MKVHHGLAYQTTQSRPQLRDCPYSLRTQPSFCGARDTILSTEIFGHSFKCKADSKTNEKKNTPKKLVFGSEELNIVCQWIWVWRSINTTKALSRLHPN